jgi:hypothetical protein
MTFRVVNFTTGEIVAELGDGLKNFDLAIKMAENLAKQDGFIER